MLGNVNVCLRRIMHEVNETTEILNENHRQENESDEDNLNRSKNY